jgi:hypothetical protein
MPCFDCGFSWNVPPMQRWFWLVSLFLRTTITTKQPIGSDEQLLVDSVMQQQFIHAVSQFSAPNASPAERKAAERWLIDFGSSDEGWPVALGILSGAAGQQSSDVQLFASQVWLQMLHAPASLQAAYTMLAGLWLPTGFEDQG